MTIQFSDDKKNEFFHNEIKKSGFCTNKCFLGYEKLLLIILRG